MVGGTRHRAGSGIDTEIVAVEPVFDVGFAYDGFHHRGVTKIVERFESRTRRVRRIRNDFGTRGCFGNETLDTVGVWGVGSCQDRGGDQSGYGFDSHMGLVPVPFCGSGSCDRAWLRGPLSIWSGPSGHTSSYPPSAFPVGVRFHVLARNHSQQTYRVGLFGVQTDFMSSTASISARPSVTRPSTNSERAVGIRPVAGRFGLGFASHGLPVGGRLLPVSDGGNALSAMRSSSTVSWVATASCKMVESRARRSLDANTPDSVTT